VIGSRREHGSDQTQMAFVHEVIGVSHDEATNTTGFAHANSKSPTAQYDS
jgi:hypothetical protein